MKPKIYSKNVIGIILNAIIGINFLFSAYAKIPSMEVFGWTIAESTFFNWTLSEWLARLIIGLELFLGLIFILQIFIKRIAIPFSAILLVLFSLYLSYILFAYGNEANCGCYGEMIPLSTKESLIKNGIILVLLFLANRFAFQINFTFQWWILLLLAALSFGFPFYADPPASIILFNKQEVKTKNFPVHLIADSTEYLDASKKIIALVSPTCKYCKKAAKRMGIMKKRFPELPFQLVMTGHRDHITAFLEETRSQNIPLIFIDSVALFQQMNARNGVPTIKWIEDSTVIKRSTYYSLNEKEVLEWLKE
jgi:hypothetical protein